MNERREMIKILPGVFLMSDWSIGRQHARRRRNSMVISKIITRRCRRACAPARLFTFIGAIVFRIKILAPGHAQIESSTAPPMMSLEHAVVASRGCNYYHILRNINHLIRARARRADISRQPCFVSSCWRLRQVRYARALAVIEEAQAIYFSLPIISGMADGINAFDCSKRFGRMSPYFATPPLIMKLTPIF